jgi:phosphatidate cytidylyltransferase
MSYLDPLGEHTSSGDRSPGAGDDGRDERPRARHSGAAPDPYAPDPDPYAPDRYADDPYAAFRESSDSRPTPFGSGGSFVDEAPSDDGADAYPRRSSTFEPPVWDAPTAATSTAQAEWELVADPERTRGPGRRRAGRATGEQASGEAVDGTEQAPPVPHKTRAGRDLRAAILVGSSLGALVLVSLFLFPPMFPVVVAAAAGTGIWEMVRAIRVSGARPPLIPLVGGGLLMIGLAWWAGTDGLTLGLVVTVLAALLWRLGDGRAEIVRDLTAILLITVYVPFLLGFGVLLAEPKADGSVRVLAALLAVVLSDTGGYAAGVFLAGRFFGNRPMAPRISPKKSWEGFAGSVTAAAIGSAVVLSFGLEESVPVYYGALFGVVIAIVAVLGDLTESMMKRDLGIKDMSQLLPGHGGLMDRLDSIVFAVPTAYLLLTLIAPPG